MSNFQKYLLQTTLNDEYVSSKDRIDVVVFMEIFLKIVLYEKWEIQLK